MLRKALLIHLLITAAVSGANEAEARKKMPRKYKSNAIMSVLSQVAENAGLPADLFATFASIESSFDPNSNRGKRTKYKGLFNLSREEFVRGGGRNNIYDPIENANAFANLLLAKSRAFEREMGRAPTKSELYLIHQQGESGAKAHMSRPDDVAWRNIRKFYGSDEMAKKAIWGNVPGPYQRAFKRAGMNVNDITSRQFTQMWADRVGGDPREVQSADITPPMPSRSARDPEGEAIERTSNLPARARSFEDARRASRADEAAASGWNPTISSLPPPPSSPTEPRASLPARRPEEGEVSAAGTSPTDWLDNAFGKPFGELFKNEIDLDKVNTKDGNTQLGKGILGQLLGIPPQPPLFKDLLSGLFK